MGMIPFGPLVFQLDNSTQIEINSADAEEVARKAADPPIPLTIPLDPHVTSAPCVRSGPKTVTAATTG